MAAARSLTAPPIDSRRAASPRTRRSAPARPQRAGAGTCTASLPLAGILLLGCACLAGSAHAADSIYRWTDAEGNVHFGDRPPRGSAQAPATSTGSAVEQVELPDAARRRRVTGEGIERLRNELRLLHAFSADRAERAAREAEARQAREERLAKCAEYRSRLGEYETAGALYREGEDGTPEYLDDSERDAWLADLRRRVERACGG